MLIGLVSFVLLSGAFLLARRLQDRLPEDHRSEASSTSVRVAIAVLSTLSALVLSLVLSSMKTNFDTVQRDVRRFGTELVTLDTALRSCDQAGVTARGQLLEYARAALHGTWPDNGSNVVVDDRVAAQLLQRTENSVVGIVATDPITAYYAARARDSVGRLISLRSAIVSENEAFLPPIFLILLVSWFTLLFGGFGYQAPGNLTVTASMLCAAFAIASAVALMTELDGAFTGLVTVSSEPVSHAVDILASPG